MDDDYCIADPAETASPSSSRRAVLRRFGGAGLVATLFGAIGVTTTRSAMAQGTPRPVHGVGGAASTGFTEPDGTPYGVWGDTAHGFGVLGESDDKYGVVGLSKGEAGVYGRGDATSGYGVLGRGNGPAGVYGQSDAKYGVLGTSKGIAGVYGRGDSATSHGVDGISNGPAGVYGRSELAATHVVDASTPAGAGVVGESKLDGGYGVRGEAPLGTGVMGESTSGSGVTGASQTSAGVTGASQTGPGVSGIAIHGFGVTGQGPSAGVYAHNPNVKPSKTSLSHDAYLSSGCCAGDFNGDVYVHGHLTKASGAFQIDHPFDPANRYLSHSFVESPDMKNVYDGVVMIDARGEAEVELPAWFEVINRDFRYQLTPIGAPAPHLHVVSELTDNAFRIAGGVSGTRVSWQVTGIRKDAWANTHRIVVEEDKPVAERGSYLHPHLYGQPDTKHVRWFRYPELAAMMETKQTAD